jgi:triphosphatase
LLLTLIAWLHGARWQREASPEQRKALSAPVGRFARRVLKQGERRMKRRARNLAHADAPTRHRLRIAAKRMRYATEFLSSLYPQRQVRPFVRALTALQDSLGRLNDVAVAQGLLRDLAQRQPAQALAAGYACGLLQAREPDALRKLCKRWKGLRRVPQPG